MEYDSHNFTVEYIDSNIKLDKAFEELQSANEIAFDLEFDRNKYSYGFNLCLIQIASSDKCYIIDPLVVVELTQVFKIFENSRVLKVVHSPGEDLRLLHSLKCYPKNVFDVQIAAKLLDYEQLSLGALLHTIIDVKTDKKLQKSNWSKRPLTSDQILYSANDVVYLLRLKDQLIKKATEKDILSFIEEEFSFLDSTIYTENQDGNYLKEGEINSLSDYHQLVLNELLRFRDLKAQKANKPAAWLIPNDTMRDIVFDKVSINSFLEWDSIYPGIRNLRFKQELEREFATATVKAEGLSKIPKNRFSLTDEEKQEKLRIKEANEIIRETKFKPIQNELENRYGVFAGKYILGDGLVGRLIRSESKISDIREIYRKELILSIANVLNIDISEYV